MNDPNTYDSNNPKQKYTPIEQMLGQIYANFNRKQITRTG